jgi:predicted kinase
MLGIDSTERHWEPYEQGIYSREITERTYAALVDEAGSWLRRGKPVVLDASFLKRDHREAALRLAFEHDAAFLALECEANEATIIDRLSDRQGAERVVSDGRWEIYRSQQENRDPVDELPTGTHVTLDTTAPLQSLVDEALKEVVAQLAGG